MGLFNSKTKFRDYIIPYLRTIKNRVNLISLIRLDNKRLQFTDADNDTTTFDLSDVANDRQGEVTHIQYPQGASLFPDEGNQKGVFMIHLPLTLPNTNLHIRFDVHAIVDQADLSFTISVGGFLDNTGEWYNCSSRKYTAINAKFRDVNYGIVNATNKAVIQIGAPSKLWKKPSLMVCNMMASGSNSTVLNLATGWSVEFIKQADYDGSLYNFTHGDTAN